jgi:hypothetical protein
MDTPFRGNPVTSPFAANRIIPSGPRSPCYFVGGGGPGDSPHSDFPMEFTRDFAVFCFFFLHGIYRMF